MPATPCAKLASFIEGLKLVAGLLDRATYQNRHLIHAKSMAQQ
jgi:hypothetical protein